MDNQQERHVTEAELGWVAGIIEGEGYVGLSKHKKDYLQFVPRIQVINTDLKLLEKYGDILKRAGLPYYRQILNCDKRKPRNGIKSKKKVHKICISGFRRVARTAKIVLPYMLGEKKHYMELILDFIKHRTKKENVGRPYTDIDWWYYNTYKKLRESSETIRRTPKYGDDIVQLL